MTQGRFGRYRIARRKRRLTASNRRSGQSITRQIPLQKESYSSLDSKSRLESFRTKWQYGEWQELTSLAEHEINRDPEREKLAILIAAAHSHVGNLAKVREFAVLAKSWGCTRQVIARVLISSAQNTLARCAASLEEDEQAESHFKEAIGLVEPRADITLLAHTRKVRETARMGLLPDALAVVENGFITLESDRSGSEQIAMVLKTELEILKHELVLSIKRGQLYSSGNKAGSAHNTLESRAVSQLGQDLWVLERTNYKRNGYFVEFGASDGVALSNTWLLENEFDWNGICAEPNPKLFEQLKNNRSCIVSNECIGAMSGEKVDFILADVFGGMKDFSSDDLHAEKRKAYESLGEVMEVSTISLHDFLVNHKAPEEIDYVSIDTEGSEFEILKAFPFDRWKIRLITVEHNHTPLRQKIRKLLIAQGYRCIEAQWDDWYELVE